MKNRILAFALAMAAIGTLVSSAGASTIITYNGLGYSETINYVLENNSRFANAGELLVKFDGNDEIAYCVDLRTTIKDQWKGSFMGVDFLNGGNAVAFLYDTYASTVTSDNEAAALQVAIWEVIEDYSTLNLSAGNFRLIGAPTIAAIANAYLGSLPGNLDDYQTNSFVIKSEGHPRSQALIVPEPGTLAALLVAIPILLRRRPAAA